MKKELTQKVLIINSGDSALEVGAHVSINTVNDMNKSLAASNSISSISFLIEKS